LHQENTKKWQRNPPRSLAFDPYEISSFFLYVIEKERRKRYNASREYFEEEETTSYGV
jgi:hypothetical protein